MKVSPIFILLCIICFVFGSFFASGYINKIQEKSNILSPYFLQKNATIKGEIMSLEKVYDFSKIYKIKIISIGKLFPEDNIFALVDVPYNYTFEQGNILEYRSKIYPITSFGTYNYTLYMGARMIFFKSYFSGGNITQSLGGNILFKNIREYRQGFINTIKQLYPENEGILLGGILIGARENLPKDLSVNFNNSGLTHIIAVSGFNVTILIIFVSYLFGFFPKYIKIIGIGLFLFLFTILVGYNPPVVRASIMGFLGYLALEGGRTPSMYMLSAITLSLMLIYNPFSIGYDISFQLSFLSVLGVVYLSDSFKKIFKFIPNTLALQESLVLTFSALVFTFPLTLYYFGQMSIIAPLSNILVAPTLPIAMLTGFISIIAFPLIESVAYVFSYVTYLFLTFDIHIVNFFGSLQLSIVTITSSSIFFPLLLTYYITALFIMFYIQISNKKAE